MRLIFKPSKKSKRKVNKICFFKPVKLYTSRFVGKIPLKNLTWPQATLRFPRMSPFGDNDRDGILNAWDCKPFDKRRHSKLFREEVTRRLFDKKKLATPEEDAYSVVKRTDAKYKYIAEDRLRKHLRESAKTEIPGMVDYRTVAGKSIVEGAAKRNYKIITRGEIIKHIEKHPYLLEKAEKVKFTPLPEGYMHSGKFVSPIAFASVKGDEISIAPYMKKKTNVGEVIEHELGHIEQREDEKVLGLKPHKGTLTKDLPYEEYKNLPYEEDADYRAERVRKEAKAWKEEKPETIRVLDNGSHEDLKEGLKD